MGPETGEHIRSICLRTVLDSYGEEIVEAEVTTAQGVFRGVSASPGRSERVLKSTLRALRKAPLGDYRGYKLLYQQNTPATTQALSNAIFMASAAIQKQSLLGYVQRLARREKQNIPAVIFDLLHCGEARVQAAVVVCQNVGDAMRQLLDFRTALRDVLADAVLDPAIGVYTTNDDDLDAALARLHQAAQKTNVHFLLDMRYNTAVATDRTYKAAGQHMKEDQYVQWLNELVRKYDVVSVQNGFRVKNAVKSYQTATEFDPELRNERKIVSLADFADLNDFFDFLNRSQSTKLILDLRGYRDARFLQTAIAVGCNFDQLMVGGLFAQYAWARVNELRRIEETGEFICGCEEWIVM